MYPVALCSIEPRRHSASDGRLRSKYVNRRAQSYALCSISRQRDNAMSIIFRTTHLESDDWNRLERGKEEKEKARIKDHEVAINKPLCSLSSRYIIEMILGNEQATFRILLQLVVI